jgi:hypothetical protein
MGEQLAMRVEQRIQTNPNTSLPDFIRNELADYRNGGNASGYSEMVATMTNKLQKDGYLPVLALQAAREDFDDISQDHKKISKKDLAAQNKMSPAQDAFECFLDGAGRNYLSTNYSELKNAKREGAFGWLTGNSEVSNKDLERAIKKEVERFEKNPRFINASNFAPPKDIEPKKAEVKIEVVVAPIKPADKNDLADILRLPTSPYRVKSGDTFNEIIASHYSHLFKFERPAAAQVVLRLNPEVKDANVIRAGSSLALPTEGSMTAHIRHRRRVHKTH